VNFADAIAVIISRPFFLTVTDCDRWSDDVVVASPFVRIDLGKLVNVLAQCFLVGRVNDAQSNLAGLSPDCPHNGWAVVLVRSMSAMLKLLSARGHWPTGVHVRRSSCLN
jgi:hypothetical protein